MADVVQFRLERMVDELEDLVSRGLFSRQEVAEIVKRRRDFEYRLKRPRPLKQDFLAYVDYESKLDALRVIRKKKLVGELKRRQQEAGQGEKKSGKLWKRSISDVAGVARILEIYRLAVVKYKGDLDLWFRYLEFCRERKHGRMKQLLAQAIRFHPKVPGLWIYAAAWEFDHNLNVAAARALMQSGLRECSSSEDLWIEYLRMELTYLNKLKARKIALGEEVETVTKVAETDEARQWKEENGDLFLSLNEEQAGPLEESENFFWKHGSSILQTIYRGAVEAIPNNMSIRRRFLEVLDNVELVHSDELRNEVMEDIKKQFSKAEDYWDWIARLHTCDAQKMKGLTKTEALSRLNESIQVYEEALNELPSAKMFSLYAKFFSDLSVQDADGMHDSLCSIGISIIDFDSNVISMFEKAESCGFLSDDLAHQYVSYYLQIGKPIEARKLAEKFCAGVLSNGSKLWSLRISIEMKWSVNVEMNYIFDLFKLAIKKVSVSESEMLWHEAFTFFSNRKEHFEKLSELFMVHLAKSSCDDRLLSVCQAVINWVFQRQGIQSARSTYRRILALPRPSLSLFMYCIQLESNLSASGDNVALLEVRKIFEAAISIYSKSSKLWKDYYALETKVGTSERASAVYWRSQKALDGEMLISDDS